MRNPDFKSQSQTLGTHTVDAIKANDDKVLKSLYTANFSKVETFILQNNGTKEHAKDIFQEAFLLVWHNIKNDKFEPTSETSINGYLFTIAKYKWFDMLRSNNYKKTVLNENYLTLKAKRNDIHLSAQENEFEIKLQKAMKAFNSLGEPCKLLLKAFYFDKMSMKELANEMNMGLPSIKNKKYRCMQKLRELVQKQNNI